MMCMYIACEDSWYGVSSKNYDEYQQCAGDLHLNWRDKGFRTILDLLQVSLNSIDLLFSIPNILQV